MESREVFEGEKRGRRDEMNLAANSGAVWLRTCVEDGADCVGYESSCCW